MTLAYGETVPGAVNFRDVGGLRAGAAATRSGVLFRSGSLARLGADARATIAGLGIRRVIDLRDDDEVRGEPSALEPAVDDTVRVPLFLGSVTSFFENDISLPELYDHIVDESAANLVAIVRGVVEVQPVLVHCTAGKDRTGVSVALALAAAGVDEEDVVADYARTAANLSPERNRRLVAWLRAAHPTARHAEELATASPAPVMRGLLARIRREHGSAAGYLSDAGLGSDEVRELRRVLVADSK